MTKKRPTVALVLAGGQGTRIGVGLPKQYRKLAGKPLLRWSLETLCNHQGIDHVKVVIHPDSEPLYRDVITNLQLLEPVYGGPTRYESSRNGIQSFKELSPGIILIHDGARPFITPQLLDQLILNLTCRMAVVPGIQIVDALKKVDNRLVEETVDPSNLWRIQTPQAFQFDAISSAYQLPSKLDFKDDAAVAQHSGIGVHVIEGLEDNIKITFPRDFENALKVITEKPSQIHVVSGFDAHKFGLGDHVKLCGIRIPFSLGLIGHSDADVALHALVDALLSGIDRGDIGQHFPSNEEKWRDQPSEEFLSYTMKLVNENGAKINHIDITVICNQPRISEFRDVMRDKLSQIVGISRKRISIKGTTTDGLGFAGRGEGIAVQATVTMIIDNE
tara:strand:- start:3856 stop:5022 length:1167 start_codon:yes stop_codon:yes gene_type:complete